MNKQQKKEATVGAIDIGVWFPYQQRRIPRISFFNQLLRKKMKIILFIN